MGRGMVRSVQSTEWKGTQDVDTTIAPAVATPEDVARYFLGRAFEDGDLITNLKMQKLVYLAYAWVLARTGGRLFAEPIEARPNGPNVASLDDDLSRYGRGPIEEDFLGEGATFAMLQNPFPRDVLHIIDGVYEAYIGESGLGLTLYMHGDLPWQNARQGLDDSERGNATIRDEDILVAYTSR